MSLWRRALAVVAVATVLRLLFAALIPVFPDETYYWEWSRHLQGGYFDHPPGIALLIRAGTLLLAPFGAGDASLAVRIGANLCGTVAALGIIGTARRLAGNGAALRAAIVISVLPLAAAGLILATPDAPVLAATAVGLYGVVRALECTPGSRDSLAWWSFTGVVLGLAFCSKYTSIFLPVAVVLAIVVRPELRARLREPGPYVACVIATLIFLPVLLWNARHDWVSFVFQLRHGLSAPQGSALVAAWKHEGDFFGGQAGLASPILFIMLAMATGRALSRRAQPVHFLLGVVATLSFGFFVYSALRQRVEPNWPAPAYIPAIVLLSVLPWSRPGERWLKAGIVFAAVMSALIYVQGVVPVLPIAPPKDPIARAFGWDAVTQASNNAARRANAETHHTTWQGGDRYQEASEIAFHSSNHPETIAANASGRTNQYDLWPRFPDRAAQGDNLVLLLDESDGPHEAIVALAPYFAEATRDSLVVLRRGSGVIGQRRVWVLRDWRGGWIPNPLAR